MPQDVEISLSVVSHGQIALVLKLLADINRHCAGERMEVILTLNLSDEAAPDLSPFAFPVRLLHNSKPLGFGANHNQAFAVAMGRYFCVLNPDIRLHANPFPCLIGALATSQVGVVAPLVVGVGGTQEDSARKFPTPRAMLMRLITGKHAAVYAAQGAAYQPDWVGGMFMLLPQSVYRQAEGFDERYFLYYEDVDLCARLRLQGWKVMLCPGACVTHDAQRSSHKSLRYLRWHLGSMLRFYTSRTFAGLWHKGFL
jgi:N-acetylglucosaminyl-diphospho-decaprenol L-rhamnosyltransferase